MSDSSNFMYFISLIQNYLMFENLQKLYPEIFTFEHFSLLPIFNIPCSLKFCVPFSIPICIAYAVNSQFRFIFIRWIQLNFQLFR